MLKPSYLEKVPESLVDMYSQAEEDIIVDMARRISTYDYFIPSAEHQFRRMQEMGSSYDDIVSRLAQTTKQSKKEVERLIKEAGAETLKTDQKLYKKAGLEPKPLKAAVHLQQTLRQGINRTNSTFANLTRTTARIGNKQFTDALDRAYMQISTGAFDPETAIKKAVKDLSSEGLTAVNYASGRHVSLEGAVRSTITTGVNQNALAVQEAYMDDMGCDLVETTAHGGSRPEHALWQGKVFSRSGTHSKYSPLRQATGYGTGAGLGGWNCRHSMFPFFEGISEKAHNSEDLRDYESKAYSYNGKKMTEYEAVSKQRYIERQVRRWKREYAAMDAAGLDTAEARIKIKKWRSVHDDFIQQTGLKKQPSRTQIYMDKKPYINDMAEWLAVPSSQAKKVIYSNGVEIDGIFYRVDGKHVVSEISENEERIANLLATKYGKDVEVIPRVNHPAGVSTPDYKINGVSFDLKTLTGVGKNTIYNAVRGKRRQAGCFILDLSNNSMTNQSLEVQLASLFSSTHTQFVEEVVVIKKDLIVTVMKRKKKV